ncbi:hypothetical protein [Lacticaseibacillus brantae]|nr:hypothetical protein [Lacticaseibacillus brantae]
MAKTIDAQAVPAHTLANKLLWRFDLSQRVCKGLMTMIFPISQIIFFAALFLTLHERKSTHQHRMLLTSGYYLITLLAFIGLEVYPWALPMTVKLWLTFALLIAGMPMWYFGVYKKIGQ